MFFSKINESALFLTPCRDVDLYTGAGDRRHKREKKVPRLVHLRQGTLCISFTYC